MQTMWQPRNFKHLLDYKIALQKGKIEKSSSQNFHCSLVDYLFKKTRLIDADNAIISLCFVLNNSCTFCIY